jgi:hypothetical protein
MLPRQQDPACLCITSRPAANVKVETAAISSIRTD